MKENEPATEKVKEVMGKAREATGKATQVVGSVADDTLQHIRGKVHKAVGLAQEKIRKLTTPRRGGRY